MYNKYIKAIDDFKKARILVVGDIMVDKYIYGASTRLAQEAPVPVVLLEKEEYLPGGAGNVANNISALGGKVYIAGVIGADEVGKILVENLAKRNIDISGVIIDNERPTTAKIRVIAGHQQVVRIDVEEVKKISAALTEKIISFIENVIDDVHSVIISDYGKGVISKKFIEAVVKLARVRKKYILVDPKIEHFLYYKNVTCLTPNLNEAITGVRHFLPVKNDRDVELLGKKIIKILRPQFLVITRGEKGMSVFSKNSIHHLPTEAREVFDVTGAGDTVVSLIALGLSAGLNIIESSTISNYAAGMVVEKKGTATVSCEELKGRIRECMRK
jgi:D-beta-D-heptose 7-phosphate kinase/D-beta-D-heptose 1-phosphate adenosyltransferase